LRGVGATGVEPACTITLSAGYKPEGIRPCWPPRSRTERYCLIRAAPSTGWVAAIDLARHLGARLALAVTPPFEAGSEAHSRRTLTCQERKVRVSSPRPRGPSRVFKARCRAGGAPSRAESGELESQRSRAHPRSKRSPQPWRVHSPSSSPAGVNRPGMEEDGRLERQRLRAHPLSKRGPPPDDVIFRARKEVESNDTVACASASNGARPQAGSPSTFVAGGEWRAVQ
jgi:hypothetical protein